MTITILPLFLAHVLKVGAHIIGLIEGIAESTATLLKIVSGWFSDRLGKRKSLTVLGYGLSTIAKPFLYLANTWGLVLGVRFTDRVGKGIRTSPRDALLADSTPKAQMGRGFGFHRAMDTLGAVVGLAGAAGVVFLLQRGALELSRDTYQTLVLIGIVPAVMAVLLAIFFVHERKAASKQPSAGAGGFDTRFKVFLGIMFLFTLGNSSDAFLILRAWNLQLSVLHIFLLLALFNVVYAISAFPAGVLSDRFGRKAVIVAGWSVYALIYLGFALATAPWQALLLFVLYGLYHGATEGVARAFVADVVPAERRGTAYGLYHGVVGAALLPASVIAGWLWQQVSPAAPFFFGAGLAAIATVALIVLIRE